MKRIFRAIVLGAAALTSGAQADRGNTRRTESWPDYEFATPSLQRKPVPGQCWGDDETLEQRAVALWLCQGLTTDHAVRLKRRASVLLIPRQV